MAEQVVEKDKIKIDVFEELFKAYEIVHGEGSAFHWRRILWKLRDKAIEQCENTDGAGI